MWLSRRLCLAGAAALAAGASLAVAASSDAASPKAHAAPEFRVPKTICSVAETIEKAHTMSEIGELMDGDFKLSSALLLVGMWGARRTFCGHDGEVAHNILLNGIEDPALDPLVNSLQGLSLPSVPNLPTVHVAFPTVSIGKASGRNVGLNVVPLSIRWLQWGRGVTSVDLSVVGDNGKYDYPHIRWATRPGGLHLTPVARLFPPGHTYSVCLTIWSFGGREGACSRNFAIGTSADGVFGLNVLLNAEQEETWNVPYPANQIGIVSSGGIADVTVDRFFLFQTPERVTCGLRWECVPYVSGTFGYTGHTLHVRGVAPNPLRADFLVYLIMR
jgi:hypothetical protein